MKKIKAAVARTHGAPFSLEILDLEDPRDDEILVRLAGTGVCHTDLVVRDGMLPTPLPVVLGHEGSGIVEKVGRAVAKVRPGDPVVMTYDSCGRCPNCVDHLASYCHDIFAHNFLAARADGSSALSKDGERVNGNFFGQSSFASHALCHERNVVKVPETNDLALLAPLACGVQTGAGAVVNALKVRAGKSFAVFGSGSVGLSAVMAAKVMKASTIIAVDTNQSRLGLARDLGATHTIHAGSADPRESIMKLTGSGLNFALDTTGSGSVIREAVLSLAPMGTCGVVGASGAGSEIHLDEVHFMSGGRRLMGIVEGESVADEFIPQLVEWFNQGWFPFDRLVKFYGFEQINDAMQDSAAGRTIKPVIRCA